MPATATRKTTARKPRAVTAPTVIDETGEEVLDAPVEFTVTFTRDGDDEKHEFRARPSFGYKQMRDVAKIQSQRDGGGLKALMVYERLIVPALCDDDGTPAKWQPEFEDGQLIGPDGELHDKAEATKLSEFDAGSSRRRWRFLMDDDDDVQVELDEITAAYELLVEAASDRPTRKP